MSIEQLDLLLCDTYQMDAWFPFGWKWKKELEKSSYSVWAIDELKRYIVGRLYPKKSGSVEDFIIFVGDFRRMMNQFSKINPDNNFMFSVAVGISTDVLDLLHAIDGGDYLSWFYFYEDGISWIDFNHRKTVLEDGLEVYVVDIVYTPRMDDEPFA